MQIFLMSKRLKFPAKIIPQPGHSMQVDKIFQCNGSWPHEQESTEEPLMVQKNYNINSSHLKYGTNLLLKVFENRCQQPGCTNTSIVKHHTVGTIFIFICSCPSGHEFKFCSSHEVKGIYTINMQAAASILLSVNSFNKTKRT